MMVNNLKKQYILMKTLKILPVLALLLTFSIVSKAQKVSADSLKMLLQQKEYLKVATDINDLKIKLANERNNKESIKDDIADKMRKAENATSDSKSLTARTDIGDAKSIKKAANAAEKASKLAKDVERQNDSLKKSQSKIDDYIAQINKLEILIKRYEP